MSPDVAQNSIDETLANDTKAVESSSSPSADPRVDDFAQILQAYNDVTEKLQHSHEVLSKEVVRLQKELANKNEQLARSKRLTALGEMAAGIAHEIRNPLAAIHLYADMIADDLVTSGASTDTPSPNSDGLLAPQNPLDTAASNSKKIVSAVTGLNAIVNDVLSFARELEPKPADIKTEKLFQRAIDAQLPLLQAANIETKTDIDLQSINLDADLICQAMINLIRNAVDAISAEGENHTPGCITLSATTDPQKPDHAIIQITDTGPGIAEQQIDRLFNPFFTTRKTGTGLGLAIVHRIIDAHGGAITVKNKNLDRDQSTGAIFQLILPIDKHTLTHDNQQQLAGVQL